jgi:hypothetical protein
MIMPMDLCPKCLKPEPKWLESTSAMAVVNYYRCDGCGHVWHIPKAEPDARPTSVTVHAEREDVVA